MAKPAARAARDQTRKGAESRAEPRRETTSRRETTGPDQARAKTGAKSPPAAPLEPLEPELEEEGWVAYPLEDLGPTDPADAARYIAQMTRELSAMAAQARLETLSYLLSMSAAEADIAAQEAEESDAANSDPDRRPG